MPNPDSTSFDLDRAVRNWRWRLRLRRFLLAEDLDELESHLLDRVDDLVSDGLSTRQAFAHAVESMGSNDLLASEYRKVRFVRRKQRRSVAQATAWNATMLKNYLKTAVRSFRRHPGFAAINLGGLAIGLSACLLIGLFVRDELAFDRFHEQGDQIHRLGSSTVGWPYGRILADEYPEVEQVVYMRSFPSLPIKHNGSYFYEPMRYADEGFFDMFSFPLVEGTPDEALRLPWTVVLSESFARTLFGSEPALGQTLMMSDTLRFTVSGVAHVPEQSHIQFSALVSFETLRALFPGMIEEELAGGWLDLNVVNYIRLGDAVDPVAFAEKIRDLPTERAAEYLASWGSPYRLGLEPLSDLYLKSPNGNQLGPKGSMATVQLLAAIGLFLLLIAIVNFVNLTTARSVDRAREVGVRKVMGSTRTALVRQFLGESIVTTSIAVVIAFLVALAALPVFNNLADRTYEVSDLASLPVFVSLIVLAALVGVISGFYPAIALSSFRPIAVMAGRFGASRRGARLRQGLVIVQFVISGVLVIGTLVVMNQLRFMQDQSLGFDAEQVLVLDARKAPYSEISSRGTAIRNELQAFPGVTSVSRSGYVPGRGGWQGQLSFPEGMPDGQSVSLEYVPVDFGYVGTMGLNIIAGRDFDESFATDAERAVIVNEAAVAAAGWASAAEAVGKIYTSPGSRKPDGVVIGVVEDYHHHGLQSRIGPMMFGIGRTGGLFALRLAGQDASETIARLQATWTRYFEGYPYEYFFLDEDFARQYQQEQRLGRIFMTFALLTILIAALGLFGLAAFTAVQRTKEIGVRKVLGASSFTIVGLLSRGFLVNVLIAFVLAIPIAHYAFSRWLEQFAYRVGIGPGVLFAGGVILVAVSLATVSYQALRAAAADPVRSLRYE